MILTCPECSTRFLIKDDAIGPNGRTVRCSQCTATWFVAGDPDVLSLQDDLAETAIAPMAPAGQPDQPREQVQGYDPQTPPDAPDGQSARQTPPAHIAIRDRKEEKKVRRRLGGVLMIWVTTLVLLALMALLAYLFRASIVDKVPASKSIYDAFGIEASASGLKLEINPDNIQEANNEGIPVTIIRGTIKNYDMRPRNVPLVKFSFVNANREVLASWVVEPHKPILPPGATLSIVTQYPNRPVDAKNLIHAFVDEMGAAPQPPNVASVSGNGIR